jgi:two-component system chemotaxis response regulator CheB
MHQAGSWTIAQDESTSVVYGMPAVAAKLGAAREILPLPAIPAALCIITDRRRRVTGGSPVDVPLSAKPML